MTLEEFAKNAGVVIIECNTEDTEKWDGGFGYTTKSHPNSSYMGSKSKRAAYERWLINTFDEDTAKALHKWFEESAWQDSAKHVMEEVLDAHEAVDRRRLGRALMGMKILVGR